MIHRPIVLLASLSLACAATGTPPAGRALTVDGPGKPALVSVPAPAPAPAPVQVAVPVPPAAPATSTPPAAPPCQAVFQDLIEGGEDHEQRLIQYLTQPGEGAVTCADQVPAMRPQVLDRVLGLDGDPPGEWVAAAHRWLEEPSPDPMVVHFLAAVGVVEMVPRLEALAGTDPVYLMSLARLRDPGSRRVLEKALGAALPKARAIAAAALQFQGAEACVALRTAAEGEAVAEPLASELFALAYLRCPEGPVVATRHLGHAAARVRMASAAVLGRLADRAHAPLLLKLLADPDTGVIETAALGLIGQPPERAWVGQLLAKARRAKDWEVTGAAINRAAALGARPLLPAVRQLVNGRLRRVPEVLVEAVAAQRPGFAPLATGRLRRLAEHGTEGTADDAAACKADNACQVVRVEAVLALGRMGDRRALPLLTALVRDTEELREVRAAAALALWSLDRQGAMSALASIDDDPWLTRYRVRAFAQFERRAWRGPGGGGSPIEVTVSGQGTPQPILRVRSPAMGRSAHVQIQVSILEGDRQLPVEFEDTVRAGADPVELALAGFASFERSRPLAVDVRIDEDVASVTFPALGDWASVQYRGIEAIPSRWARLKGRQDVLSTYTDLRNNLVVEGVVPGFLSVDREDEIPEAE